MTTSRPPTAPHTVPSWEHGGGGLRSDDVNGRGKGDGGINHKWDKWEEKGKEGKASKPTEHRGAHLNTVRWLLVWYSP
jgi:hypothetical protein